jgi:hypothetical protein
LPISICSALLSTHLSLSLSLSHTHNSSPTFGSLWANHCFWSFGYCNNWIKSFLSDRARVSDWYCTWVLVCCSSFSTVFV